MRTTCHPGTEVNGSVEAGTAGQSPDTSRSFTSRLLSDLELVVLGLRLAIRVTRFRLIYNFGGCTPSTPVPQSPTLNQLLSNYWAFDASSGPRSHPYLGNQAAFSSRFIPAEAKGIRAASHFTRTPACFVGSVGKPPFANQFEL